MIRLLRCNWFAKRRYYPVKLTKQEKKDLMFLDDLRKSLNNDFIDFLLACDKQVKTGEELYALVYDYCLLPVHPTSSIDAECVFCSRYLITKEGSGYQNTDTLDLAQYERLALLLYEQGLINHKITKHELKENSNYHLISFNNLSINEILSIVKPSDGIIIINNCNEAIQYQDYQVLDFTGNYKTFKKQYQGKSKIILKTTNLEIFPYLLDISYSINCFTNYQDTNYFYSINVKRHLDNWNASVI